MELIDPDISSAQPQCMNESKFHWGSSQNHAGYSLQQLLHYQLYLERDTTAYFVCGCAIELPTWNFKLYQHIIYRRKVHSCGPGGSMRAYHTAGSRFDPRSGQVSWVRFFRGFSSPIRQMSGSFRPQRPWISFGHHYHRSSFIMGARELRSWRALKPQIYILYLVAQVRMYG